MLWIVQIIFSLTSAVFCSSLILAVRKNFQPGIFHFILTRVLGVSIPIIWCKIQFVIQLIFRSVGIFSHFIVGVGLGPSLLIFRKRRGKMLLQNTSWPMFSKMTSDLGYHNLGVPKLREKRDLIFHMVGRCSVFSENQIPLRCHKLGPHNL